jgi:hypothetical protein
MTHNGWGFAQAGEIKDPPGRAAQRYFFIIQRGQPETKLAQNPMLATVL